MRATYFMTLACTLPIFSAAQLQVQKVAELFLQNNALICLQGDLESDVNIEGNGSFIFSGNVPQTIHAFGHALPSVFVENTSGVALLSPVTINKQLILQSGKLTLGRHNIEFDSEATVSGNTSAYIITEGSGKITKSVQRNLNGFAIPIGTKNHYAPLLLRLAGKYVSGEITVAAKNESDPNKPISSKDYLQHYWTVDRRGVNGELIATAFYNKVSGNEGNIQPYYWNGSSWINKQTQVDTKNKSLTIAIPEGTGHIYAMRKGGELSPQKSSMTLLPNPVRNTATLIIRSIDDDNTTLRITDNGGTSVLTRRVILKKGVNQVNIDVMSLTNGHYVISSTLKNTTAIKMIKQ